MIPTVKQLAAAAQGIFLLEDWHNFGLDYHKTTKAWFNNFDKNWPKLKNKYDERFYRMWKYYLLACSGGFKAKNMHLWQIVFSKTDYDTRYQRVD
jgi:cyclopropane-fatty-acyl-phospholipid synthase